MADYGGGSDEENAELKKLNAEVVRRICKIISSVSSSTLIFPRHSWKIQTASTRGRSSFELPKGSKEVSTEILVLSPSMPHEMSTIAFSQNFRCSSDTGKSMPTWSSRLQVPKPRRW